MANTPFLDLVKPAGTDRALVSVINSNSDKIDGGVSTISEQIGNVNKWIQSALSNNYDTVFTELSDANSFRYDLMSSSATSAPTNAVAVCFTTKRKTSSVTLGSQMAIDVVGRSYIRNYTSDTGTWSAWQRLVTADQIAKSHEDLTITSKAANTGTAYALIAGEIVYISIDINVTTAINAGETVLSGCPTPYYLQPTSYNGNGYMGVILQSGAQYRVVVTKTGDVITMDAIPTGFTRMVLSYIKA